MSIGAKGALNAAKVMALAGVQLLQSPELVAKAKQEFDERRGAGFRYVPLLQREAPPLDYRRKTRD